ncbi:hypothetical protein ACFQY7_20625 [Actinomadura luteofluorescens]|uniref:hypothetical protein n=1 Tax=Actinomadura luteofluorescens TaxID=46163 RepID=UPI003639FB6D
MEKIPTLFERDDRFRVVDRPRAECAWVFEGAGTGTEKLDGTNVRLTVRSGLLVRVEKRRNPSKAQKQQGIVDGWYVDAAEGPRTSGSRRRPATPTSPGGRTASIPARRSARASRATRWASKSTGASPSTFRCRPTRTCPAAMTACGTTSPRWTAGSLQATSPKGSSSTIPTAAAPRSSAGTSPDRHH